MKTYYASLSEKQKQVLKEVLPNRRHYPATVTEEQKKEIEADLGRFSDAEIAKKYGIEKHTIRQIRVQKGIDPNTWYRKRIKWDDKMIALLGTDTDNAIAERLGVSHSAVRDKRMKLRIKAFGHKMRPRKEYPQEMIDLLGTIPDEAVGLKFNLCNSRISSIRRGMGIPAFQHQNEDAHFSEETIKLLGTLPDIEIHKTTGIPVKAIRRKRKKLNIPSFRERIIVKLEEIKPLLSELSDDEIAEKYNVARSTISKYRNQLGDTSRKRSPRKYSPKTSQRKPVVMLKIRDTEKLLKFQDVSSFKEFQKRYLTSKEKWINEFTRSTLITTKTEDELIYSIVFSSSYWGTVNTVIDEDDLILFKNVNRS